MLTDSHYITAFTSTVRLLRNNYQAAACGRFVLPSQHSSEPTCPKCLAYVQALPASVEEAFGTGEDDRPDPIKPEPDFRDVVREFDEQYKRRHGR